MAGLSSLCCSVIFPRRVEEVIETAAEAGHVEERISMAVGRKPGAKAGQPSRRRRQLQHQGFLIREAGGD